MHERDAAGLTRIRFEVPAETVEETYKKALRALKRQVNVPGFRRGKVPPKMVESILGPEAIGEYAKELLRDEVVPQAMAEVPTLVALDEAELEMGEVTRGAGCEVTIQVLTAAVELDEYQGRRIEQFRAEISEAEATAELERYFQQQASYVEADHTDVRDGDHVVFALRIVRDGYLVEEYDTDNPLRVEIGHNQLNPSLDEHLLGLSVDQTATFEVTYPEEYDNEDLRGQTAEFTVRILALQARETLAAFVERSGIESVEAFVAMLRERMAEQRRHMYRLMAREEAVRAAVENSRIDIPQAHLDSEVMDEIDAFEEDLEQRGVDLDGLDAGELEAEEARIRERVEYETKREIVLRALAQIEALELTNDDMVQELSMISTYNRVEPRLLMRRLEESGELAQVARSARIRKAAEHLYAQAEIVEIDPPADGADEPLAEVVEAALEASGGVTEGEAEPVERTEDEPCP